MLIDEDEQAFLARRIAEEKRRMAATSCLVRTVYEEMVDGYAERLAGAEAETAALNALAASIGDDGSDGAA